MTVGIITGLAREADCFGAMRYGDTLSVCCVGGDSERAVDRARALVSEGCVALVSFGIAGGLQPSLDPGTVVIAASIVGEDGSRMPCDVEWRRRLITVLKSDLSVVESDLLGRDQPVLLSEEKRRSHRQTGAAAVDMESLAVARVAAEYGLPFLAARAIADPAGRDLPSWVPGLVGPDGRPRIRAVIRKITSHPGQAPVLFKLAKDSKKAFAALRRVAISGGPFLQFRA